MDWTRAVDLYCERTAPGLWNEPWNLLSNLGFVLVALWAAAEARRRGVTHPVAWLLIVLAGAIGVGSGLFHSFANGWSELADTLPIWTFVAVYVLAAMRWLGGMAPGRVALWAGLVVLAGVAWAVFVAGEGTAPEAAAPAAPDPLNGSGQYAPALVAMLVLSGLMGWRRHPCRRWMWAATGAFVLSLGFRTVDQAVCAAFPRGTHFLWHLLNAAMIAALLQMLLRVMSPRPATAG